VLLGCSGGLVAAKFVKCPKSYYTEQFEKYGYIRDKYDTTYNTPTPYDPSLVGSMRAALNELIRPSFERTRRKGRSVGSMRAAWPEKKRKKELRRQQNTPCIN